MKTESHLRHKARTAPYAAPKVPDGLERGTLAEMRVKRTNPQVKACILKTRPHNPNNQITRNFGFCTTLGSCEIASQRLTNDSVRALGHSPTVNTTSVPVNINPSNGILGFEPDAMQNDTVPCLLFPPANTSNAIITGHASQAQFRYPISTANSGWLDFNYLNITNNTDNAIFGCTSFDNGKGMFGAKEVQPNSGRPVLPGSEQAVIQHLRPSECTRGYNPSLYPNYPNISFPTPQPTPTPTQRSVNTSSGPTPIDTTPTGSFGSSITLGGALTTAAAGVLSTAAAFITPTPTATIAATAPFWNITNVAIIAGGGGALLGLGCATLGAVAVCKNLRKNPEPFSARDIRHTTDTTIYGIPKAANATQPPEFAMEPVAIFDENGDGLPPLPGKISRARNENSTSSEVSTVSTPSSSSGTGPLLGRLSIRSGSLPPPPFRAPIPTPEPEADPGYEVIRPDQRVRTYALSRPSNDITVNPEYVNADILEQRAKDLQRKIESIKVAAPVAKSSFDPYTNHDIRLNSLVLADRQRRDSMLKRSLEAKHATQDQATAL